MVDVAAKRTSCDANKYSVNCFDGLLQAHSENEGWHDATESHDCASQHIVNCFSERFKVPYAAPHVAYIK